MALLDAVGAGDSSDVARVGGQRGHGLGPEALEGQPQAERQLPEEDRDDHDPGHDGCLLVQAEDRRGRRDQEQRGPDESHRGDGTGHEARPVQHIAEQQGVEAGHDAGADQEGLVADGDEALAHGDQRGRVGPGRGAGLTQHHDAP